MADHCACGGMGCPNLARKPQPDPQSTGINWYCVDCGPNCEVHLIGKDCPCGDDGCQPLVDRSTGWGNFRYCPKCGPDCPTHPKSETIHSKAINSWLSGQGRCIDKPTDRRYSQEMEPW